MFTLYPAIDLKDGKCVRLTQGDMNLATIYEENPAKQAASFEAAGAGYLHVVDLDGAFVGKPANETAIKTILQTTNMQVQLGGGIRCMDVIGKWLDAGVSRVILGTVSQKNPQLVKEACRVFPDQVVVGIDARGGMVATDGWAKQTTTPAIDLARSFEDAGVAAIIYTDIMRDGTMDGPNFDETINLAQQLTIPVIASGGIRHVDDVRHYLANEHAGINGAILGKSLYEGRIDLKEAMRALAE